MKQNGFAMKEWHLKHAEQVIVRFVEGSSPDASSFEKRNHRRYGTLGHCIKQIEYDMKHGVEKTEVLVILSRLRSGKKHERLRSDVEAMIRLDILEDKLSGANRAESLLWYDRAFIEGRPLPS